MFVFENDEARNIVLSAGYSYKEKFGNDFPTFLELPNIVTVTDALAFEKLINKCIKRNKTYAEPPGVDELLY